MIPFIDLTVQHREVEAEIRRCMEEVIGSSRFILGPALSEFEEAMARWHGVRHAIGVASGTDALLLALLASGVGPGDEVITSPFTFVATAEVIAHAGARPVFVDIGEESFNLEPAGVEGAVTEKTSAIMPVHLYGLPVDMDGLLRVVSGSRIRIVEDCAQATGAKVGDRPIGALGDAGAYSFFPTKNLGGLGDGGMVLTDSDDLAEKVGILRSHGATERDLYRLRGYNSRLDSLQAAVLTVKLRYLEKWNEQRRQNAALYREFLGDVEELRLPSEPPGFTHVYNQFTVMTERRDQLQSCLAGEGIGSMVYYPKSLHLQPVFSDLGYRPGDFPVAEKAQAQVLSLPVYPGLPARDIRTVSDAIRTFFGRGSTAAR